MSTQSQDAANVGGVRRSRLNLARPPGMTTVAPAIHSGSGQSRIIPRVTTTTTSTDIATKTAGSSFTLRPRNSGIGNRFTLPPGSNSSRSTLDRTTPLTTPISSPAVTTRAVVGVANQFTDNDFPPSPVEQQNIVAAPVNDATTNGQVDSNQVSISATESKDGGLPEGWVEAFDPGSGIPYYFHAASNVTQWERPTKLPIVHDGNIASIQTVVIDEKQVEREVVAAAATTETTSTPVVDNYISGDLQGQKVLLPNGWVEILDEGSGQSYYFHAESGETSWNPPPLTTDDNNAPSGTSIAPTTDDVVIPSPVRDKSYSEYTTTGEDKSYSEYTTTTATVVEEKVDEKTPEQNIISQTVEQPSSIDQLASGADTLNKSLALPVLPPNWVELVDSNTGMPYYVNEATGVNQWDRPVDDQVGDERQLDNTATGTDSEETVGATGDSNSQNGMKTDDFSFYPTQDKTETSEKLTIFGDDSMEKLVLPAGWVELEDTSSGTRYYYNESTGEAQWDRPQSDQLNVKNEAFRTEDTFYVEEVVSTGQDIPASGNRENVQDTPAGVSLFPASTLAETSTQASFGAHNVDDEVVNVKHSSEIPQFTDLGVSEDICDETQTAANLSATIPVSDDSEEILKSNLPPDWEELIDEATGSPYYFNQVTSTTQWDRPTSDLAFTGDEITPKENATSSKDVNSYASHNNENSQTFPDDSVIREYAETAAHDEVLPPGWEMYMDEDTGKPYYVHEARGLLRWDRPTSTPVKVDIVDDVQIKSQDDATKEDDTMFYSFDQGQNEDATFLKTEDEADSSDQHALLHDPLIDQGVGDPQIGSSILQASADDVFDADQKGEQLARYDGTEHKIIDSDGLPSGWVELKDEGTDMVYYYNESSGMTQWDRPSLDGVFPGDNDDLDETMYFDTPREEYASTGKPENDAAPLLDNYPSAVYENVKIAEASGKIEEELPPGWVMVTDEDSGNPYYVHDSDGTVQWDRPSYSRDTTIERQQSGGVLSASDVRSHEETTFMGSEGDFGTDLTNQVEVNEGLDAAPRTEMVLENDGTGLDLLLPKGWLQLNDEATGQPYYLFEADGTTQWERPTQLSDTHKSKSEDNEYEAKQFEDNGYEPETRTEAVTAKSVTRKDRVAEPESTLHGSHVPETLKHENHKEEREEFRVTASEQGEPLPPGWTELIDEKSGNHYYLFEEGRVTQWDRPTALALAGKNEVDTGVAAQEVQLTSEETAVFDEKLTLQSTPAAEDSNYLESNEPNQSETFVELPDAGLRKPDADNKVIAANDIRSSNIGVIEEAGAITSAEADGRNDVYKQMDETVELPAGWVELFDETSGVPYYLYEPENITQWEKPIMQRSATNESSNDPEDKDSEERNVGRQNEGASNVFDTVDIGSTESGFTAESTERASGKPGGGKEKPEQSDKETELPPGWVELFDETSKEPYYLYEPDNVTQWEKPTLQAIAIDKNSNYLDGNDRDEGEFVVSNDAEILDNIDVGSEDPGVIDVSEHGDGTENLEQKDKAALLPEGWVELFDETSGEPFYLYEPDNVTQWEKPTLQSAATNENSNRPDENDRDESEFVMSNNEEVLDNVVVGLEDPGFMPSIHDHITQREQPGMQSSPHSENPDGIGQHEDGLGASRDVSMKQEILDDVDARSRDQLISTESRTHGSYNAEACNPGNSDNSLPPGWVELVHEGSGVPYYFLEADNITQWEKPSWPKTSLVVEDGPEKFGTKYSASATSNGQESINVRLNSGRPPHAFAVFGFGGRLCVQLSRNKLALYRTFSLLPRDTLVRIEKFKRKCGITGPLNDSDDKAVRSYIQKVSGKDIDLLWSLIRVASDSRGKLRSDNGVVDDESPETSIVKLLLQADEVNGRGTGISIRTLQQNGDANNSKLNAIQDLLIRGRREEAVEEAVKSKNHALALLVALMCSREAFQFVGKDFAARSLVIGHPLYTITMLFSGNLRSDTAKAFWDSLNEEIIRRTWCSHLAAIISNRTNDWEFIVIALGDRLLSFGEVMPSHFCYLVCGCPVSNNRPESRLTLLGCNVTPADLILMTDSSILAVERTEAYEWSKRRGNQNALISSLQSFKLMYAMLLADFGLEQSAVAYAKSIADCMGWRAAENEHLASPRGPVALHILSSDKTLLLAHLAEFQQRLRLRLVKEISFDRIQDVDGSFVTAQADFHTTMMSDKEEKDPSSKDDSIAVLSLGAIDKESRPGPLPENYKVQASTQEKTASREQQPELGEGVQKVVVQSLNGSAPINGYPGPSKVVSLTEESKSTRRSISEDDKARIDHKTHDFASPPATTGSRPRKMEGTNSKLPTAPSSAPANLERLPKKSPSSGGLAGFIRKFLNPEAVIVDDLGDTMEAYFDKKINRWVFPGDDPAELAKPLGPPPKMPVVTTTSSADKQESTTKDPLAAMMAPPSRSISSKKATTPGTTNQSNRYPPGLPPSASVFPPVNPPQFAVFAPKPASSSQERTDE